MKKIILGIVMLLTVSSLSGCVSMGDEIEKQIEVTKDNYEITNVDRMWEIENNWYKYRITVINNDNGAVKHYYCRFNSETKKIIFITFTDEDRRFNEYDWIRRK